MKKLLSCILLLTLVFLLIGCANLGDLSTTTKIVVTKYTEVGEVAETVTVTETEKIQHICDNLNSLQLTRKDPSEGLAKTYELTFIARGTTLRTVFITSNEWLAFDGYTHAPVKGELDLAYIKGLFPCPFRWVGTEDGHHKHMLCDCCDEADVVYPHEDPEEDTYCNICGYKFNGPTNQVAFLADYVSWLSELSAENVAEIKTTFEYVGVAPGRLKDISRTTNQSVITDVIEYYTYTTMRSVAREEAYPPGGNAFTIEFILTDGTVKELHFNNGFYAYGLHQDEISALCYFVLDSIPTLEGYDNVTKSNEFIAYIGTGTVYDKENNPVCEIPIDELEFVESDGCVDAVVTGYYYTVETEFGTLWFDYSNDLFYLQFDKGEDNYREYYRLVCKNLDELIAEYSTTG